MTDLSRETTRMTAGLDLGDNYSYLCLLDHNSGEVLQRARVRTTPEALKRRLCGLEPMRIAIETGTHSPWVSRLLEECSHEVVVANSRKVRLIHTNKRKSDQIDAENLARIARLDPKLLYPVEHRSEKCQAHMALIRSREALVESRTRLVNHVRGSVKALGHRLPKCSSASFHKKAAQGIPEELREVLGPVLETIASLTERIKDYDRKIEALAEVHYPQTRLLRQVRGVGTLTALAFVLTLEEPERFEESRAVGAYLGLVPAKNQSGDSDPEQHISKEGEELLRRLLVGSAHYILGPFGEDSDLRRHGEKIAAQGATKSAKKRAIVAVARKLAVLMHRLWVSGEVYEPLYNAQRCSRESPPLSAYPSV
jgi:transposase